MSQGRSLTQYEISQVPDFISSSIDLTKVRIINRPWTFLTPKRVTVARGYNIFWPNAPIEARTIPILSHLIHELVHVWQYNHLRVGLYSIKWLDRRYKYSLDLKKGFLEYGLEQQAAIIQDAYLSRKQFPTVYAKTDITLKAFNYFIEKNHAIIST